MPELPEVESTVSYLKERIIGFKVLGLKPLWKRTLSDLSTLSHKKVLPGAQITEVKRRGKFILLQLQSQKQPKEFSLLIHLRMSGSLSVVKRQISVGIHDRMILEFENGKDLRFDDTRKFGRWYLVDTPELIIKNLGLEPLSPEFTVAQLSKLLNSKKGAIKPLLLNQTMIAGIGNIYADEALWQSGIHPLQPAFRIKSDKIERLHAAIINILQEAITSAGTDFGDGVVEGGAYTPKIYDREGENCQRCDAIIKRIVVGQRGTHICPTCQPEHRRLKSKAKGG